MKITKVSYTKAFVIGAFLQEKIGIEVEIDDSETPEKALTEAKKIAEQWHIANNPQVHGGPEATPEMPVISRKEEVREIGLTPELILSSPDLKVLESYKLLVKNNPELNRAYQLRKDQLENQQK